MLDFLWNSLWGWIGITGVIVIAAVAVAWFIPAFRNIALAVAGGAIAATTIYTKGSRDRAALEQRRKEEAVKKIQERYDAIDKRKDDDKSVEDRLDRGNF
jgi:cytochrome b subunit of formate dehydrogenase